MFKKLLKRLAKSCISDGRPTANFHVGRSSITVACLALLLFAIPSVGSEAKWSITLDKKVKWHYLTFPGILVVATDQDLRGIDPVNGTVLWQLENLKIKNRDAFWPIYGTPYALIHFKKGGRGKYPVKVVIDVTTGREVWNTAVLEVEEFTGDMTLESIGALMFSGIMPGAGKEQFLTAADLKTGETIWKIDGLFKEKWEGVRSLRYPWYDSNGMAVFFNKNRSLRKLNLRTGETIWETKGYFGAVADSDEQEPVWVPGQEQEEKPRKPPERVGARGGDMDGFAPLLMSPEKDRIYVPYQNTVRPMSTADGAPLWENPPFLGGRVAQMALFPDGLLVRTATEEMKNERIHLLDAATGEVKWRYPVGEVEWTKPARKPGLLGFLLDAILPESGNQLSYFILAEKTVVVMEDDKLLSIDLDSGRAATIASFPVDTHAGNISLDPSPDGFLLIAPQDIFWYDAAFREIRHIHHPPPDDAAKGGAFLLGTFFANTLPGADIDYSYGMKTLMREYHATSHARDFLFMLAELQEQDYNGPALLKISKTSGETVATLRVKSKKPDYLLDWLHGKFFLLSDKKQITCYEL